MTKILWDIDGVFNPFMAVDLVDRGFVRFIQGWINWDLDLVNHGAWMRELEKESSFVWASSWEEESNALVKWFHLDKLSYPHVILSMPAAHTGTWKLPSVTTWVEENVPADEKIVWVDDEVQQDAFDWATSRGNTLIVRTDPSVGLTFEQFSIIQQFIR